MFCTRARSCARADDAKISCAVRVRNAKLGNHLKSLSLVIVHTKSVPASILSVKGIKFL